MYLDRTLSKTLSLALNAFPAVLLTGPRQSGKTTFLRHELNERYDHVSFDDQADMVIFHNRGALLEKREALAPSALISAIRLDPETLQDARSVAPGWDIYMLEQEWRSWMADGGLDAPRDPDKAFLGFCRRWYEKRGAA